MTRYCFQTPFQ